MNTCWGLRLADDRIRELDCQECVRAKAVINELAQSAFIRGLSEKSEYEGPTYKDSFEKLLSTKLCIQFTRSLHGRSVHSIIVACNRIWLICGVSPAGSACRVRGVQIGR